MLPDMSEISMKINMSFLIKKCRIAKKIEQVSDKNQQYYQKKDLIVDVFTMKII